MGAMADWREGPFLISAAPGAGKTRPALEFAREQLQQRRGQLGGRGLPDRAADPPVGPGRGWAGPRPRSRLRLPPAAQRVPWRLGHLRADRQGRPGAGLGACRARTLVIADEAHHLGEELSWGVGFTKAFARGLALAAALRDPVSLRRHPDPGRRLRQRWAGRARRLLQLRRGGGRRCLPPGVLRDLRRHAVVAQRRRRDRVELRDRAQHARGQPPLPHRDLHRSSRWPAPHPARGRQQAAGDPPARATGTPAAWSSPPTPSTPGGSPSCCAR